MMDRSRFYGTAIGGSKNMCIVGKEQLNETYKSI